MLLSTINQHIVILNNLWSQHQTSLNIFKHCESLISHDVESGMFDMIVITANLASSARAWSISCLVSARGLFLWTLHFETWGWHYQNQILLFLIIWSLFRRKFWRNVQKTGQKTLQKDSKLTYFVSEGILTFLFSKSASFLFQVT